MAVLALSGVAAVSLGDVVAGWYVIAGRAPSAAGEYPVRIALRRSGPPASGSRFLAQAHEPGAGDLAPAAETATAAEGAAHLLPQHSAGPRLANAMSGQSPTGDGALAIKFDLADTTGSRVGGSAIEIRKAIRLNGADAGDARIHVDASSTLSMAREELGRILVKSGRQELIGQLGSGGRFVSFDEMRSRGIEVRYDPVLDRILVSI
ncbi:hypothetical protein GRI75_08215 [Altererythrobacter soli]|uniref:Uncharacterized protein n=1 Tax=Croceibacterium soli TaxID=1739690 RepID=A0A6I4UXB8_9SPHN|nr:hypothetical protein [Croceibacterium soli]MXP41625.1 hypothetical protein [Croceibacterium soli]